MQCKLKGVNFDSETRYVCIDGLDTTLAKEDWTICMISRDKAARGRHD